MEPETGRQEEDEVGEEMQERGGESSVSAGARLGEEESGGFMKLWRGSMKRWLAERYNRKVNRYMTTAGMKYDRNERSRLRSRYQFLDELLNKGERLPTDLWDEGEEDYDIDEVSDIEEDSDTEEETEDEHDVYKYLVEDPDIEEVLDRMQRT